jgi:hypothetical protein
MSKINHVKLKRPVFKTLCFLYLEFQTMDEVQNPSNSEHKLFFEATVNMYKVLN